MKTKFWYESNACWGMVSTTEELVEKLNLQMDPDFGGINSVDEFLDNSKQHNAGSANFGTYREHSGSKSLREFLKENDSLEDFINKVETNQKTN